MEPILLSALAAGASTAANSTLKIASNLVLDWLHQHDGGKEGDEEESKSAAKNGLARRSAKWGKQLLAAMAGKGEDGTEMATAGNLESLRKELTEEIGQQFLELRDDLGKYTSHARRVPVH